MFKDGFEDIQRWKNDRIVNNGSVQKYDKNKKDFVLSSWKDIKVGDMIKLSANERIPADLLLYHTSDPSGQCFIETIDIDGESNLKQRSIFKAFKDEERSIEDIFQDYYLEVEAPNKEIYKFNGKIMDAMNDEGIRLIKSTNLVLRDTLLRNTDEIRGLVIYAGHQTKTLMNNKKPRFKRSLLEDQLNLDILWCIGILIILCIMTTIGNIYWVNTFSNIKAVTYYSFTLSTLNVSVQGILLFLSSIIIYQAIIPLPLYVTLELTKAHQILHISSDVNLYDEDLDKRIEVRAYNITEDMGQIKYMFCDKTGTLTENVMIFKKATVGGKEYITDNELKLHLSGSLETSRSVKIDSHLEDFLLTAVICNTTIIGKTTRSEKKLIHLDEFEKDPATGPSSNMSEDILTNFNILPHPKIEAIAQITIDDFEPIPKDLVTPQIEIAKSVKSKSSMTMSKSAISVGMLSSRNYDRFPMTDAELFKLIQSESPDEDALVKFACSNGYKLYHRNIEFLTVWNEQKGKWMDFEILKTIPFDSVRKCMSVIVRCLSSSLITMYTKGADSVMFKKLKIQSEAEEGIMNKIKVDIHAYACDGLRTLVLAKKELSESDYLRYERDIFALESNLINNEESLKSCYDEIETNLHLIGAAGIEDKLQDQVPEILECFKEAGINIWILTGDKRETAINIAYSTRLFSKNEIILEIIGDDEEEIYSMLRKHRSTIEKSIYETKFEKGNVCSHQEFGLVIDGCSLAVLFNSDESRIGDFEFKKERSKELRDHFFQITYFCNSVVCCRCTPIQKADVVSMIKKEFNVRTLAVGDGANDVNMIQTADIGIGIGGKEGMQATMASDFSICKFKYLKRLILVHGHLCYDRLARMSLYIFYKDMFIAMVYFLYQIFCGFSMSIAIDQITQIIFHLIHTGLPPLIFGIWDKDFDDRVLMANPSIYKLGINSKMYRFRDFWRNITDAIWQAMCVTFICFLSYQDTEIGMAEFGVISVSCVIVTMFGHILIESKHWNPFIWFSCVGCLLIGFYCEMFLLNSLCVVVVDCKTDNPYKVVNYVMAQGKTYLVIGLSVTLALLPRVFFKSLLGHSRNSLAYEAQHRINERKISRIDTNCLKTRYKCETSYQMDYKNSIYYLGNLEEFKKIECQKCEFRDLYFSDTFELRKNVRLNQVVPFNV